MRNGKTLFSDKRHFIYSNNGGNPSNQFGFIAVIHVELPLMPMLLHFM